MIESYSNYEWYLKQDLSSYAGNWLAIINKKVVAISKDINEVVTKSKKDYPNKRPFITKINNKLSVL